MDNLKLFFISQGIESIDLDLDAQYYDALRRTEIATGNEAITDICGELFQLRTTYNHQSDQLKASLESLINFTPENFKYSMESLGEESSGDFAQDRKTLIQQVAAKFAGLGKLVVAIRTKIKNFFIILRNAFRSYERIYDGVQKKYNLSKGEWGPRKLDSMVGGFLESDNADYLRTVFRESIESLNGMSVGYNKQLSQTRADLTVTNLSLATCRSYDELNAVVERLNKIQLPVMEGAKKVKQNGPIDVYSYPINAFGLKAVQSVSQFDKNYAGVAAFFDAAIKMRDSRLVVQTEKRTSSATLTPENVDVFMNLAQNLLTWYRDFDYSFETAISVYNGQGYTYISFTDMVVKELLVNSPFRQEELSGLLDFVYGSADFVNNILEESFYVVGSHASKYMGKLLNELDVSIK